MSLGNKCAILIIGFFLSCLCMAQEKEKSVEKTAVKKVTYKLFDPYAVGLSYMLWNEELIISQGSDTAKGFANYGGYGLSLEKSWMQGRWLHGTTLSYNFGKATSGGFDSSPSFADGVNRAWSAMQVSGYSYYRFNTTFMMGLGLLGRYRTVDWKPADETITINSGAKTQIAGQFLLRWRVNNKFSFIQAYTLLNLKNSVMWTWTAQVDL